MKKLIIILMALCPAISNAQKIDTAYNATKYSRVVIGNNFKGAVFDAGYFEKYLPGQITSENKQRFTPTDEEILFAEKTLQQYLRRNRDKAPNYTQVHKWLKQAVRQYFGYIDNNGDRLIIVHGFSNDMYENDPTSKHKNDWYLRYVDFFDGGCSIWLMQINLSKKTAEGPGCNGVA